MSAAEPRVHDVVHAPGRLRICAVVSPLDRAEAGAVRDPPGVADSVASKQLQVLEGAGYVRLGRPTGRGRVKTWAGLTPTGKGAFAAHVAALKALIEC